MNNAVLALKAVVDGCDAVAVEARAKFKHALDEQAAQEDRFKVGDLVQQKIKSGFGNCALIKIRKYRILAITGYVAFSSSVTYTVTYHVIRVLKDGTDGGMCKLEWWDRQETLEKVVTN